MNVNTQIEHVNNEEETCYSWIPINPLSIQILNVKFYQISTYKYWMSNSIRLLHIHVNA